MDFKNQGNDFVVVWEDRGQLYAGDLNLQDTEGTGVKVVFEYIKENGCLVIPENDVLVTRVGAILGGMGIDDTEKIHSWGCYEANIFQEKGITMLNIADGSRGAHTSDENMSVENLIKLEDLVYRLMVS